jgi:ribosomal protein S18 acetylase RimI-like enzyme
MKSLIKRDKNKKKDFRGVSRTISEKEGPLKIKNLPCRKLASIQDLISALHNEIRRIDKSLPEAKDIIRKHLQYLKTKFKKYNGRIKIIEKENKCIGYIIYLLKEIPSQPDDGKEPFCYIQEIYIQPGFRKMGLGTTLVKTIMNEAKGTPVHLFVFWENRKAYKLYKRMGFRERIVELVYNPEEA